MTRCSQLQRNSGLLQSFIHLMNDFETRNEVMSYHIRHSKNTSSCQWWGTCVVRLENGTLRIVDPDPLWKCRTVPSTLEDFIGTKRSKLGKYNGTIIFTVCLLYDTHSVHYVSFVYSNRVLLSFDPGVELYPHGQKTIVPLVHAAFKAHHLVDSHSIHGACSDFVFRKKKHGVQFNGMIENTLPADAFCQSWTLFFLIRMLYLPQRSMEQVRNFLRDWCAIPPTEREYFITSFFILPTLTYFPKINDRYLTMLPPGHRKLEAMEQIFAPLERCFFPRRRKTQNHP